jgi:hypothetical protein
MKSVPTYTATIYCGLKQGYDGPVAPLSVIQEECQEYVDHVGLAVTITPTEFRYTHGHEPGVIIGLINYPRFPSTPRDIKQRAVELALHLMMNAGQHRVTVLCSDETIMLEQEDAL